VSGGGLGVRLALLGAAMALAAVNTGNNLIYLMLSLVLALALVGAVAGRRAARLLSVAAHLPREVHAGEPFTVHFEAKGRFPLLPRALVVARLEGLPVPIVGPVSVPSDEQRGVCAASVTIPKRGVHDDLEVTASTGYPFGLTWLRARPAKAGAVVVLPSFLPIRTLEVGGTAHPASMPLRTEAIAARGAGTEVLDLREYAPSDDARHIDWRASARARQLMVREYEREDTGRNLEVVIDTEAPDDASFETVVSRAAAILDFAQRHRHDARLVTPDDGPLLQGAAMRWLAGVRRGDARAAASGPAPAAATPRVRSTPRGVERIVVSADPSRATPLRMTT